MRDLLIVGAGGFLGAILRYGVHLAAVGRAGLFPLGTLVVNVLGCFGLGLLAAWLDERPDLSPELRLAFGTGLFGALTTFSTFGVESLDLVRAGEAKLALASVVLNLVLGFGAAWLGRSLITSVA
ncbi:MAG: fluoride efflux transporter CrcB [Planctomycetota bacterium]|nr:fluoride efflux transporter CrcB [Planctomycetota bacterium]